MSWSESPQIIRPGVGWSASPVPPPRQPGWFDQSPPRLGDLSLVEDLASVSFTEAATELSLVSDFAALDLGSISEASLVSDSGVSGASLSVAEQAIIQDLMSDESLSVAQLEAALSGDTGTIAYAPQSPVTTSYTSASGAFTYAIPNWCSKMDVILIGGGASGRTGSGSFGQAGVGGDCGDWLGVTLERGVNIPWSTISISITVGAMTGRAANSDLADPVNGNATFFVATGYSGSNTAAGGVGNRTDENVQNGRGSGDFTLNGITYSGSANSSLDAAGNPPGGGGSGGDDGIFGNRTRGWEGARGAAYVRAYQ